MFTGIIEELATIRSLTRRSRGARLSIESAVCGSDASVGDSISVNGVCLTLTSREGNILSFDVSDETSGLSNILALKPADRVNLERSLKQGGRLGGHFVTGHIDCMGKIVSKASQGDFIEFEISIPKEHSILLVKKGSVAVDGISLTVNNVSDGSFKVMVIPHTLSNTTLNFKGIGNIVNIETDVLAKYVQNLTVQTKSMPEIRPHVDRNFLAKHGFA